MNLVKPKSDVTDVISHDVSPLVVNTDARSYTRLGYMIVLGGVLGFLLWAGLAPLDKGVPLNGTVAKESNHKAVQHLSGGIVDDILVHDGDIVKAGQVLVRMNAVTARSQAEISTIQWNSARLVEARLMAERDGKATIAFPPDLLARRATDQRMASDIMLQQQLFQARRQALDNELAAADQSIHGIKLQTDGLKESRDSKKVQLGILKEQVDNMRDLAKEGYVPRSRLLEMERTFAMVNGNLSEDIGNIGRNESQMLEIGRRRAQRMEEYQKDVRGSLADAQRESQSLASRTRALEFELANAEVKAPVDGVVTSLAVFTRGGVIGPGTRMMDLVPLNDVLVVEGQLPVNLIDKVKVGLPVELIFSALNTNKTPHLPGEVTQVGADRLVDEHSGIPYYKVRAKVSPAGMKEIAHKKLDIRAGMPVELFVKTGERTMMNYLLKPVMDRAKTSMTEE